MLAMVRQDEQVLSDELTVVSEGRSLRHMFFGAGDEAPEGDALVRYGSLAAAALCICCLLLWLAINLRKVMFVPAAGNAGDLKAGPLSLVDVEDASL